MTKLPLCLCVAAIAFSAGCTKSLPEKEWLAEINKFENEEQYPEAIRSIEGFVDKYPKSTERPVLMKKLALLYAGEMKDFRSAIKVYKKIVAEVDDPKLVAQSQFMAGYI